VLVRHLAAKAFDNAVYRRHPEGACVMSALAFERLLDPLRVHGPGRCTECSFHVATQGHRNGCSTTAPLEPEPKTAKELAAELLSKGQKPMPWDSDVTAEYDKKLEAQRRRRAKWRNIAHPEGRGRGYHLAALRGEAGKVAESLDGTRNHKLNAYTFKLRKKYVDDGNLTNDEVAQAMYDAAIACGYVRTDGRGATISSIASGLGIGTSELQWLR
jgi:hypothetical protein